MNNNKDYIFDINEVELKDLLGNDYKKQIEKANNMPFHRFLGNQLFLVARTVSADETARKIFNADVVEMNEADANEFKSSIEQLNLAPFMARKIQEDCRPRPTNIPRPKRD